MLSSLFTVLLAAEDRILDPLPTYLGMPLELLLPVVLAIVAMVLGVLYGKSIRMEDHGWRVGLVAASFLAALSVILFWEYKLGVDLKGGAILVYEVDEQATADNHPQGRRDDWQMSELLQVLKRRLNPDGLKEIVIRPFGPKQVEIVVPEVDADEIEALKDLVGQAGILRFLILADSPTRDQALWEAARSQAADAPTDLERTDRSVRDPSDPDGQGQIIGFWADVKRKAGTEEPQPFAQPSTIMGTVLLRDGDTGQIIDLMQKPTDYAAFQNDPVQYLHSRKIKNLQVLMVVDPEIDIRGSDLALATESMDQSGRPCINFVMKGDSIWKMSETTSNNRPVGAVTRKLGIVWDNVLESAPAIQSTISQRGEITGDFSVKEVRDMVELLRSGAMPVVLKEEPISDDRIGATLGADTVRKGSEAIIISLAIVLGFVLFYYRTAGVIACFALVLNMMLTVALMFALKAPFTLPGLAGLVLTVGMSVDANVLIYERIREELEKGASLRMAIRNGFDKALITIIDSNVTTLLTAVILYVIGTDQVRGFGMTLILGIVTSMFTAIFASRAILEIGEKAYRWQTLEMMKFFTKTNIDWMGAFKPAAIASVIVIVIGLAATVARGTGIFDIDLAGGTSVQFVLDPKVYPQITEAEVREKMAKAFDGVTVERTNAKADYNVYQKFLAADEGTAGAEQMIWKVDSSLEEVDQLQEVVRKAFRTEDGREGLQTYGLTVGEIKEIAAAPAVTPPAPVEPPATSPPNGEAPKSDAPKVDGPKLDAPMTETPKTEAPKTDSPKADTPKLDAPKSDAPKVEESDKKKDEENKDVENKDVENKDVESKEEAKSDEEKDASGCQEEEETKPKEETKSEEAKSEDSKATENKDEAKEEAPAATDPAKNNEPKTEPPQAEAPQGETPSDPAADPAAQIPPADPLVPQQPAVSAMGSGVSTQVELNLGNTKITGENLQDRIKAAGAKALNRAVLADVTMPGRKATDAKSYSDWTITLPLTKEEATKVVEQLQQDLSSEPVWQTSSKIGGQVSADTRYRAIGAIVGSIIGMIVYMWIRFHKISWGIAAAVALAHDALIMLGAIAVSYWLAPALGFLQIEEFKISLPVVAAFLTLIGYSVNDTIVIFDRVREIRGKSPDINGQMVNDAVNQTLSRTFLTAGTTLVVIVILYFLGGSGIHAFAFSLVVGVISGSYSTVFIASPLLVYLIGLDQEKGRKNVPAQASSTTARGAA